MSKTKEKIVSPLEAYYLELDSHLTDFTESRAWQLMLEGLKQQRTAALEAGIYDESEPVKWYQGYVSALEYLINLPERIKDGAKQIRETQDQEDELAKVQAKVAREYQGGGEVA